MATDVGGTFTDLAHFYIDKDSGTGKIQISKTHTTPGNYEDGVLETLRKTRIDLKNQAFFIHGTTVVINAILERKCAKTALLTTAGFRDVLEIGRGSRPDIFNFKFKKQPALVDRYLRFEVEERMNYKGEVVKRINLDSIADILPLLKSENIESLAICFLHAYINPTHEKQLAERITSIWPEVEVISSHNVTREWREYERTSSTVLAASIKPIAKNYLHRLETEILKIGYKNKLYVMQSNGGMNTVDDIKLNPITMIESGPSGGVIGAIALGEIIGKKNLIVLDIGGTTAKCTLIQNGEVTITTNYKIEKTKKQVGYPLLTPVIDIVEIGNGGGSIAWIDEGGKMHVGPKSAGADPGPSSYGKGGKLMTTCDANLICNRIHKDFFMGGSQLPNMERVGEAIEPLTSYFDMSADAVARGILRISNANMVNALKQITINKGHDPRDFSLVVFGGGGGLHGAFLAEELRIPEVIIPIHAGVFSAFGMLMADLRKDFVQTHVIDLQTHNLVIIKKIFEEIKNDALINYSKEGYNKEQVEFKYFVDMRYKGQEHNIKTPLDLGSFDVGSIRELFNEMHLNKYAFRLEENELELVNFHLIAIARIEKPKISIVPQTGKKLNEALYATEMVDFDEYGKHSTHFYKRNELEPDMIIKGPAIVVEETTSTVVPPGKLVEVDKYTNLIIRKAENG